MKHNLKLISFCITLVMLFPIDNYAQVFKKIQAEGGDLDKDCKKIDNNIYQIDIGVIFNTSSVHNHTQHKSTGGVQNNGLPCNLYIGLYVENINTTFYEPFANIGPPPSNNGFNVNGVMSFSFPGDNYGLTCEYQEFVVTVDLYCRDGNNFTPIDVCMDRNLYEPFIPLPSPHICGISKTFTYKFCCKSDTHHSEGDGLDFDQRSRGIDIKNTKLRLEMKGEFISIEGVDKNEVINLDIFTISGQKVANTQFYFESENKLIVKNTNLLFGPYFIRVVNKNDIQTVKFINF